MESLLQMSEAAIKSNLEYYRLARQKFIEQVIETEQALAKFERLMELKLSDLAASDVLTGKQK